MSGSDAKGHGAGASALPPWPFQPEAGFDPSLRPPSVMGVVNVTPDSFSDGGRFLDPDRAVEHGLRLVGEGADVLDVGGESTRPGAATVPLDEELRRVLPVIEGLARGTQAPISIDTTKAAVARAAVEAGATIVNDISGALADPRMLETVAELQVEGPVRLVLMHRQGTPETMQEDPRYTDVVAEVRAHLRARMEAAESVGIPPERLAIDPGVGFGKRLPHNLALLKGLPEIRTLGAPLVLGVSRKSFIGHLTGSERSTDWQARERAGGDPGPAARLASDRIGGTAAAIALAVATRAVDVLRVHDVAIMREAALVAAAISSPMACSDGPTPASDQGSAGRS